MFYWGGVTSGKFLKLFFKVEEIRAGKTPRGAKLPSVFCLHAKSTGLASTGHGERWFPLPHPPEFSYTGNIRQNQKVTYKLL